MRLRLRTIFGVFSIMFGLYGLVWSGVEIHMGAANPYGEIGFNLGIFGSLIYFLFVALGLYAIMTRRAGAM